MNTLVGILVILGVIVAAIIIWKVVSAIVAILLPLIVLAVVGTVAWRLLKKKAARSS